MKSSDYWEKRALAREAQARRIANREIVKDILPAYDRAARQITENVRQIFERYAKDGELTEAEARKLLNVRETEEILNKLREELKEIDQGPTAPAQGIEPAECSGLRRADQLAGGATGANLCGNGKGV